MGSGFMGDLIGLDFPTTDVDLGSPSPAAARAEIPDYSQGETVGGGTTRGELSDISRINAGGGSGFSWDKVGSFFKDAGGIAKAAMPFLGIGSGVLGALAARDAASQSARSAKVADTARETQIQSAQQSQAVAPKVEPIVEETRAFAPQIAAIAPRQQAVAERMQSDVAAPLTAFGTSTLEAAGKGELSPAEQAEIDNWARTAKAQMQQYFASAGLGNSQMLKDALDDIDREALGAKGSRLDAQRKLGITALGGAGSAIGAESDIYGGEATTYGKAANVLGTAANELGVEGNILTGAGATAAGAAQSAEQDEKLLAQLIADVNKQIQALGAGAA